MALLLWHIMESTNAVAVAMVLLYCFLAVYNLSIWAYQEALL
jgi:hypothetical protein